MKYRKLIWMILISISISISGRAYSQQGKFIYKGNFGKNFTEGNSLDRPEAITADLNGNIYVADTGNNRIVKFTSGFSYVDMAGGYGPGSQEFDCPTGVWAKTGLDVYIADKNNNRIVRYDQKFNVISSILLTDELQDLESTVYPAGCCMSSLGDLFVLDEEEKRILKIDNSGAISLIFGNIGSSEKNLINPMKITLGDRNSVFVSDRYYGAILRYDYFGNYQLSIGEGILNAPSGMDASAGNIIVCDGEKGTAYIFSQKGRFIADIVKESGLVPPGVKSPAAAVIVNQHVLLCDYETSVVHIFLLKNEK